MQNRWTFHLIGDHVCDVEFFIDYEFKSRALAMLMGAIDTAPPFAVAFEQRPKPMAQRNANDEEWPRRIARADHEPYQ